MRWLARWCPRGAAYLSVAAVLAVTWSLVVAGVLAWFAAWLLVLALAAGWEVAR